MPRHASSPTVPDTSIFNRTIDIINDQNTSAMWKPLVQHEVYEHAGDADIYPQWPGPARNGAVLVVTPAQSLNERDYNHGYDYDSQRHMRDENDQIDHMPEDRKSTRLNSSHL